MGDTFCDRILLGEFSEQTGPVVFEAYYDPVEMYDTTVLDENSTNILHFMMRAMSADHVYNPGSGDVEALQFRPSEVLMDRVRMSHYNSRKKRFEDKNCMAFIYSFQVPDVYARAFTRTLCISYLTTDQRKMVAIMPWLAHEFRFIAHTLYDTLLELHEHEALTIYHALKHCKEHKGRLNVPERQEKGVDDELNGIAERLRQLRPYKGSRSGGGMKTKLDRVENVAVSHVNQVLAELEDTFGRPEVSDENSMAFLAAVTKRGAEVLRPVRAMYEWRPEYSYGDVQRLFNRSIETLPMDSVWLTEHFISTMIPMSELLQRNLEQIFGEGTDRLQFRIGEYTAVDPAVEQWRVPVCGHYPSLLDTKEMSVLRSDLLYPTLAAFGGHAVLNVAYNALKGVPIIVCGRSIATVLEAIRVAVLFVPGFGQSRTAYQVGLIPFEKGEGSTTRVNAEHVMRNAIVGCHVDCVLSEDETPYLGNVCIWKIDQHQCAKAPKDKTPDRYFLESTVVGQRYGGDAPCGPISLDKNGNIESEGLPVGVAGKCNGYMMEELGQVLAPQYCTYSDKPQTAMMVRDEAHSHPLSNYIRLILTRLFVELTTMASLMLFEIRATARKFGYDTVPFVLTETTARETLSAAGYEDVRTDDLSMVCCIARRMLHVSLEASAN
jgi:hypothetical protein